ncbi:MAG: hypothetical protein M1820_007026 [Bogoriella megaspora]|nr:MAG: hypothetical protein M1820_007026 [Bogoriella megaspora]
MADNTTEITTSTPTSRIRELSTISADIPLLLQSASLAVSSLTNRPLPSTSHLPTHILSTLPPSTSPPSSSPSSSTPPHKTQFRDSAAAYYTLLQSISARLRRQVYALEEAGLVPETERSGEWVPPPQFMAMTEQKGPTEKDGANGTGGGGMEKVKIKEGEVVNGGLGALDVGWLNSRRERREGGDLVAEGRRWLEGESGEEMGMEGVERGDGEGREAGANGS